MLVFHGSVLNQAPATLTFRDIYPETGAAMSVPDTEEKTNPAARQGSAAAPAVDVVSGTLGIPPVIAWVFLLVGLLFVGKIITEKVS